MAYRITWTKTARNDYFGIIDYLLGKWGRRPAGNFKTKVSKQIELISRMPKLYAKTEARENIRRCIIVKQVSMYYQETEIDEEIIIVRFYDNRKDSSQLNNVLNESDL